MSCGTVKYFDTCQNHEDISRKTQPYLACLYGVDFQRLLIACGSAYIYKKGGFVEKINLKRRKLAVLSLSSFIGSFIIIGAAFLTITGLIASANKLEKPAQTLGFSLSGSGSAISVVDEDTMAPIADATITVVDSLGAKMITVTKSGYSTITLVGVKNTNVKIFLKPLPAEDAKDILLKGTMGEWRIPDESDDIHAGLIFPALNPYFLLDFDTSYFLSPLKDTINVFGPRKLPSNVVLPEQRVAVLFTTIELNKPLYRLPVRPSRPIYLASAKMSMPVSALGALKDDLHTMISPDIVNKATFSHVGLTGLVTPNKDMSLQAPAQMEVEKKYTVTVSAAPFSAPVYIAATADINGDRSALLPTDVKLGTNPDDSSEPVPVQMAAIKNSAAPTLIISLAYSKDEKRFSGIMTSANAVDSAVAPGAFLDTEVLPAKQAFPDKVKMVAPAQGLAALVFRSEKTKAPLWYVYALPSAGSFDVPTGSFVDKNKVTDYSMMKLEFGSAFDEHAIDGKVIMSALQRFASASTKIGN